MPLLRLLCAYGILFSISLFISANLQNIASGSGYLFLAVAIVCFGTLIVVPLKTATLFKIGKSTAFFLVFIAYFGVKFYFESGSQYRTEQVLIGTAGGILFALAIGFMCSHALATLYELLFRRSTSKLVVFAGLLYLSFVLFLSWGALQTHMGNVRSDLFLIEDQDGRYQRAGALACMQIMMAVSLAMILFASFKRITLLPSVLFIPLILITGAFTGLMSQLVGSNSGMVTSVGFIFIFFVNFFAMLTGGRRLYRSIEVTDVMFSRLGIRLVFGAALAGTVIAIVAIAATTVFGIEADALRIFGYGAGENTSLAGRSEIFENNFVEHLAYSPLFGHTQVEYLTTGEGTYVHSLLSIVTHLGFFGGAIFLAAVFWMYVEIVTPGRHQTGSLYESRRYGLFRLMMLAAVLVMCFYSAFFTWMPLWFAFGLYADWHFRT